MSGNEPPAATPAANANEGGNIDQKKMLSQAEIDAIVEERLGRDRRSREEALAKDLGMPLKDVKALIKSRQAEEEAKKTELEKLTGERDQHRTEAQAAKIEAAKVRALARAGADPDKIDALLKRVVGNLPEEIEADVKELKELGLLGGKPRQQATGAGNSGLQSQTPPDLDAQIAALEAIAIKTGDQRDWARVNKLKMKKY